MRASVCCRVSRILLPYDNSGNAGQNDDKTIQRRQNDDETALDMDVPKGSLKLVFRGEELPRLHSIYFIPESDTYVSESLIDFLSGGFQYLRHKGPVEATLGKTN